jgi:tetratricopeptide (TPR) repeat protein
VNASAGTGNSAARRASKPEEKRAGPAELRAGGLSAAAKYGEASILLAENASEAFKCLVKQANALQNQGEEFGYNEALIASIEIWRQARELRPFDVAPDDHRKAHNNLGSAIYSLAMRETGNERLYEVTELNREVLARDTRQSAPKFWVAATANLASALQAIGEREKRQDVLLEINCPVARGS